VGSDPGRKLSFVFSTCWDEFTKLVYSYTEGTERFGMSKINLQTVRLFRGVFSSSFILFFLSFRPSFCINIMELNIMQFFWQKVSYFSFWILVSRGHKKPKKAQRGPYEDNKFCILNKTKHNYENFSILYFIILK
jgi:hypothetical protein